MSNHFGGYLAGVSAHAGGVQLHRPVVAPGLDRRVFTRRIAAGGINICCSGVAVNITSGSPINGAAAVDFFFQLTDRNVGADQEAGIAFR